MKHRVLIPTLLMSAIGATTAFAIEQTHASRNIAQASVQQSAVVEGADNFHKSDQVTMQRVTFKNQYDMQVVGNLFIPKDLEQNIQNPAIIVGHPMGAVKEQSSNLYAQKLAEQGFITLAIDLSFWGESEGSPRNQREFFDFYRTPRGEFTPEGSSPERTTKPTMTSVVRFMNYYPLERIEEIDRPLLFIACTDAHSREFSEDAYNRAVEPKEIVWVHVDLYDRVNLIPFDKLTSFFTQHLQ